MLIRLRRLGDGAWSKVGDNQRKAFASVILLGASTLSFKQTIHKWYPHPPTQPREVRGGQETGLKLCTKAFDWGTPTRLIGIETPTGRVA